MDCLRPPAGKKGYFPCTLRERKQKLQYINQGNSQRHAEAQSRGNTAAKVFDTTGLLKLPGGLNKNHPAADEIRKAVEFYEDIYGDMSKKIRVTGTLRCKNPLPVSEQQFI